MDDIERQRQDALQECKDINVVENNLAHEALDRSYLINDMLAGYLLTHPFIIHSSKLYRMVCEAHDILADVYSEICNVEEELLNDNNKTKN